ncbi:MAG: polymer-forming cytoskeletal protein [Dinoroseobacter sp.]|nr:polymer-forming cytoskeletal protein [Dinoroseobacter sp.]MDJ0992557.1 polymer-forming cytoskeletal protein [Dinoroseobacter sp.]
MSGTVIQEDLTVQGNMTAKDGSISISGKVTGDIDSKSIDILSAGNVKGRISAGDVKISGSLEGSVKCASLTLGEKSDVKADIAAETMTMSSGAKIKGQVETRGG